MVGRYTAREVDGFGGLSTRGKRAIVSVEGASFLPPLKHDRDVTHGRQMAGGSGVDGCAELAQATNQPGTVADAAGLQKGVCGIERCGRSASLNQ